MHRGAGAGAGVRGSVKTDMHEPKGASLLLRTSLRLIICSSSLYSRLCRNDFRSERGACVFERVERNNKCGGCVQYSLTIEAAVSGGIGVG